MTDQEIIDSLAKILDGFQRRIIKEKDMGTATQRETILKHFSAQGWKIYNNPPGSKYYEFERFWVS